MVCAISGWPNARADDGLAALFAGLGERRELQRTTTNAAWLTVLAGLIALVAVWYTQPHHSLIGGGMSGDAWWLYPVLAVILLPLVCHLLGRWVAGRISDRLGGLTGDTYGAMNELLETALLIVLSLLQGLFWT